MLITRLMLRGLSPLLGSALTLPSVPILEENPRIVCLLQPAASSDTTALHFESCGEAHGLRVKLGESCDHSWLKICAYQGMVFEVGVSRDLVCRSYRVQGYD